MQFRQKAANSSVYLARKTFDRFTSYNLEDMNEQKWLRRFLFLETIAGKLKGDHFLPYALRLLRASVANYWFHCQTVLGVGHWVSFWFSLNPVSVNN